MSVRFVAKAEIEVPLPEPVRTMHVGYGNRNRVRFVVEYDAERPEEADRVLRDAIEQVASVLSAVARVRDEERS